MSLTPWKKLREEVLFKNPWWEYRKAVFLAPHGKEQDYHYLHTSGAVAIVAITSEGKIPFVRQYRPLIDAVSLELPIGGRGEDGPLAGAKRELVEETGLVAKRWRSFVPLFVTNGLTDERMFTFVACDLSFAESVPDDVEEFEYSEYSPNEIDALIQSGEITCGETIAAWAITKSTVLRVIAGDLSAMEER